VTREEMLIGWLLAFRMNQGQPGTFYFPLGIPNELIERGWLEIHSEDTLDGAKRLRCTVDGLASSDLAAPEYGIDPIPDYEAPNA
jgi:hypothetical protein